MVYTVLYNYYMWRNQYIGNSVSVYVESIILIGRQKGTEVILKRSVSEGHIVEEEAQKQHSPCIV